MDGFRVAIDGTTAVSSAHTSDPSGKDSGSIIKFADTATGWKYTGRKAPAASNKDDQYGIAIAVGAEMADSMGRKSGCVYLESLP